MIYPNFFRLAAGISLAICLQMCSSPSGEESTSKLRIVTTTSLLEDAVRNIGGDSIILQSLMGAGVDPHYYKATQGDLRKLTQADLIIYNGLFLILVISRIIYSPIIPRQNNCNPPMKATIIMVDVQP